MYSSTIIVLLAVGLIANGLSPAEARHGRYQVKKRFARYPSRSVRRTIEETTTEKPADPAQSEGRAPISKSLARKLSEMLAIAVTEAVAEVDNEPSKLAECKELMRRRNTNVNQNYNYNQNINRLNRRPQATMQLAPDDGLENIEDSRSEESETNDEPGIDSVENSVSEDSVEIVEDHADMKLPQEIIDKIKRGYRANERKKMYYRPRSKAKNTNLNFNQNTNAMSGRKEEESKDEVDVQDNEAELSDEAVTTTTELPAAESRRRRKRH